MTMDRIGYIGLGRMGSAMVKRLCQTGQTPTIWNRDPSKTVPLASLGCTVAKTPRELAANSDVILICVHDAAAVESVVFGSDGIAQAGDGPRVLVDMSTIGPVATKAMAQRLRDHGQTAWVDAPVSGGVPGAEKGTLIIMAGGEANDIKRIEPVLGRLSERISHVGGVGAGQAVKAINQLIVGGYVAIVAEALSLAERHGIDPAKLPDVLKGGLADSNILQGQGRRMAVSPMDRGGSAAIMIKDLDIAATMASAVTHALPVGSLVSQLYRLQTTVGYDAYGMIGLMRLFRGETSAR
jgi:3-hydroxyisobutyrate dehydrogenase